MTDLSPRDQAFAKVDLMTAELEMTGSIYDGFSTAIVVKGQPRTVGLFREFDDAVQVMALIDQARTTPARAEAQDEGARLLKRLRRLEHSGDEGFDHVCHDDSRATLDSLIAAARDLSTSVPTLDEGAAGERLAAKPLDWRKPTKRDRDEGGRDSALWIAPGFGGEYAIQSDLQNFILWRIDDPYAFDTFPTVDAAKAYAEADWQKTIGRKLTAHASPTPAADEDRVRASWDTEHNLADVDGFGSSFNRDDCKWHLYTVPGAKPFGTVDGYDKASIDFVMDALRGHLAALKSEGK